jgi:hypothetical protein
MNQKKLKELARDLRTNEPRPAHEKLAGFEMAARALDKCRASLLGIAGDFRFGCPMDQEFFQEAGISAEDFKSIVETGASDQEVEQWLLQHTQARSVR